jgi:hypothetical protein
MSNHKYKLLYQIDPKPEGVTKEDIPETWGACDALLLASIIYPKDGSLSIYFVGEDGRTGKALDDSEWFKVWSLLTARLADSKTLPRYKKELCSMFFETIKEFLLTPDLEEARDKFLESLPEGVKPENK